MAKFFGKLQQPTDAKNLSDSRASAKKQNVSKQGKFMTFCQMPYLPVSPVEKNKSNRLSRAEGWQLLLPHNVLRQHPH